MAVGISQGRFKDLFSRIQGFAIDHQQSFVNLLTAVVILVIEILWTEFAFDCPCTHPRALWYGYMYVLGPAILFGLLSMLCNTALWKVIQGRERCVCRSWCVAFGRATLPAVLWMFFVFLDGSVYACFFVQESLCASSKPGSSSSEGTKSSWAVPMGNVTPKAISQLIAMIIGVVYLTLAFIVRAVMKCCFSPTYYEELFHKKYQDCEYYAMKKLLCEKATEQGKENITEFMDSMNHLSEADWEYISTQDAPIKEALHCNYFLDRRILKRNVRQVTLVNREGIEFVGDAKGTYIASVSSEMPEEVKKIIHIGDRVLSVNKRNTWGISHDEIMREMSVSKQVTLHMCLQYMPEGLEELRLRIETERRKQEQNTNQEHQNTDQEHQNTDQEHQNTDQEHQNTDQEHQNPDQEHQNRPRAPKH